jgi:hypothetical protein
MPICQNTNKHPPYEPYNWIEASALGAAIGQKAISPTARKRKCQRLESGGKKCSKYKPSLPEYKPGNITSKFSLSL